MDGMSYATPVKATLLKCESAPKSGGDTGFANLHAAYAALPEQAKRRIAGLKVGHCLSARRSASAIRSLAQADAIFPRLEHPLVWTQENGQSALLIGSTARDIADMSDAEGKALLDELLA